MVVEDPQFTRVEGADIVMQSGGFWFVFLGSTAIIQIFQSTAYRSTAEARHP